jgi:hypothetical protein
VVAWATLLLRRFGTVVELSLATVPIFFRLLLFETGWKAASLVLVAFPGGVNLLCTMLFYGLLLWKKRETIVLKGEQKVDDNKIKDVIDNNCEL